MMGSLYGLQVHDMLYFLDQDGDMQLDYNEFQSALRTVRVDTTAI